MDKDLSSTVTTTVVHSSSSSYMMMPSPSCCFPIQNEFQYSRIHHFSNSSCCCCCCSSSSSSTMKRRRGWRWRSILRRLMRESKTTLMCRSNKPVSFQYDPVSYSHNFDEGTFHLHHQEPSQLVFQDHRLDSHCKI